MSRASRCFAVLAVVALVAACGPSSTETPVQQDAGGLDRLAQHDGAQDGPAQEDGPLDGPLQNDANQQDAGPATLYPDIRALQQDPGYTGTLAPLNSRVRIEGAVVTAFGSSVYVFFIQNATGPKEYSGILVKKNATVPTDLVVGDTISAIEATLVEESRSCDWDAGACPTRHSLTNVTLCTKGSAGTVPAPLGVTGTEVLANTARYDGVLLQLTDSTLTVASGGTTATTTPLANGMAVYGQYYSPPGVVPAGTVVTTCIGVLDLYNRLWEVYPRSNVDLIFQDWPGDGGIQSDALPPDDATSSGDAAPCGTDTVVISQVYGGGGNTGPPAATFNADFIELFTRGTASVDVGTWTIQYTSATGSSWGNQKVALTGKTIPAGGYLLVRMNNTGSTGGGLPTPDVSGTNYNMSASAGKVALVRSSTTLSGACPTSTDIADLVGYGTTANCFEGSKAPAGSNTTAVTRDSAGCQDFNDNGYDFSAVAPAPRNSATAPASCGC
ncbi:MAG: lamin tail domain-containing protein [Deltaproteobacteria bacterium]|nr:lamin tail domain-containing protein [Deltaproteobacteria bacterium]